MISIRTRSEATQAYLDRVRQGFASGGHMRPLARVAMGSLRRLVLATPKGYTGQTRRRWQVKTIQGQGYLVSNSYKVMRWLEEGTRAHGPVRARALWIPLNRRAAMRGPKRGNDPAGGAGEGEAPLQRGVDFRFALRVRGIRAMRIAERERGRLPPIIRREMVQWLRTFY